jgi:hypothetical protein
MIKIKNGRVFVKIDGEIKETSNPELIGLAILDLAEEQKQIDLVTGDHKRLLKIIEAFTEMELLNNYINSNLPFAEFCLERSEANFQINFISTRYFIDMVEMIKAKKLVLKEEITPIES